MKPSGINIRFQGNFREKRRMNPWRIFGLLAGIMVLVGLAYLLFYSHVLAITKIDFSGFSRADQIEPLIWSMINKRVAYIQPYRNIAFFNTAHARENLLNMLPLLEEASVVKKYPHTLIVSAKERTAVGIWCSREACQYFDRFGAAWGQAPASSGSLLLVIESGTADIEPSFIATAQKVSALLPTLNVALKKIIIPEDIPAEFHAQTAKSYVIKFALDAPVEQQLETLKIFMQKQGSSQSFNPQQYVDLRIPGRVYYK